MSLTMETMTGPAAAPLLRALVAFLDAETVATLKRGRFTTSTGTQARAETDAREAFVALADAAMRAGWDPRPIVARIDSQKGADGKGPSTPQKDSADPA